MGEGAMTALAFAERALSNITGESRAEARIIVSDLTGVPLDRLGILRPRLTEELRAKITEIAKRRAEAEPLQYILGRWEFMGLPFYCRPCALIPRQDTETLVEEALRLGGRTALDLCCGTGCIGVSLARLGNMRVTFADISPECIALSRENAKLNNILGNFLVSDMFQSIEMCYDIICINPPYIPTGELASLQREVKREPVLALDGGEDGLGFYRRIASEYTAHLNPGGALLMEVGAGQARAVAEMFPAAETVADLAHIQRVVTVRAPQ